MLRKAGDLISEFVREKQLSANRAEPIGTGGNAVVYASDTPGNVMKQSHIADESFPGQSLEDEANLQAIAAELGIAPRVAGLEKFPAGIGNRIEMQDVRPNFETHGANYRGYPEGADALRVSQQLGQLALKGIRLEDRHNGNVLYNKMTGRPLQLDFGIAGKVDGSEQAATLALATAEGFEAAGLGDVGSILTATVMDYLEGGQVDEAMDLAKQGFSRLQKLKAPVA